MHQPIVAMSAPADAALDFVNLSSCHGRDMPLSFPDWAAMLRRVDGRAG